MAGSRLSGGKKIGLFNFLFQHQLFESVHFGVAFNCADEYVGILELQLKHQISIKGVGGVVCAVTHQHDGVVLLPFGGDVL